MKKRIGLLAGIGLSVRVVVAAASNAMPVHPVNASAHFTAPPLAAIHAHLCGLHFTNGDRARQVIAHHYCSHQREDIWQCVLYDSAGADARLIGIEYVIPESVFVTLPADEKVLWHSHRYEVASGLLVADGMSDAENTKMMRELATSYGKTWHTWQVERGDVLPLGLPKLMMGFTADGQARPDLLAARDQAQGIDSAQIGRQRAEFPFRPIAAGADAWQQGPAFQLSDDLLRPAGPVSSYAPVVMRESFSGTERRMAAAKPGLMDTHRKFLAARYDLTDRPVAGAAMSRGKPVQQGPRARLAPGVTWEALAELPADEIRAKDIFPAGFRPLPHPNHSEGGMVFPLPVIAEIKRQEQRDLARFDLDFDLPDHFLPEFPAAIFLTTRPDLGDVSLGQVVTLDNFFELFNGCLNPKQLEGLRLLLAPFPQQQFNATDDRRSLRPSRGVACFDCHTNGHTNAATHLAGDARAQEWRHRIDTASLRGVNVQRLFGSQRALKSVEDFTEFEQRAAYFDGDPVIAAKKGVNVLDRGSQVHAMAEMQALFDFPPAPKLDVFGRLDPAKSSAAELRGQAVFSGRGKCADCHAPPYYTDNSMHDLRTGHFFATSLEHGAMMTADGAIKTFPLRGIKDSPPYLHDGRLLTLADTVEFFNLILGTKLTAAEKADLVAFLLVL